MVLDYVGMCSGSVACRFCVYFALAWLGFGVWLRVAWFLGLCLGLRGVGFGFMVLVCVYSLLQGCAVGFGLGLVCVLFGGL